jgi:hypothetical protein
MSMLAVFEGKKMKDGCWLARVAHIFDVLVLGSDRDHGSQALA